MEEASPSTKNTVVVVTRSEPTEEPTPSDVEATTGIEISRVADTTVVIDTLLETIAEATIPTLEAALEDQQTFENDLREILSPEHSTIPESTTNPDNQTSFTATSTLVFSSKSDHDSSPFLPISQSKRPPPIKHKSSLKRPPS
ncbi:hypothetical protein F2Q70_00018053 [Brassica cretica]|nr:hypothetical protein F2Q70_00018053 [Brassica cretica]